MKEDTTVIPFRHADNVDDVLTELAREGARRMLAEALVAEADVFVARFSDEQIEHASFATIGNARLLNSKDYRLRLGLVAFPVRRPIQFQWRFRLRA